jgi:hypothetical protein
MKTIITILIGVLVIGVTRYLTRDCIGMPEYWVGFITASAMIISQSVYRKLAD